MGNLLGLEHITTKPGGRDFACVIYLNFIRLPFGAGGGWAATISLNQILSGDVATLLFQILWDDQKNHYLLNVGTYDYEQEVLLLDSVSLYVHSVGDVLDENKKLLSTHEREN